MNFFGGSPQQPAGPSHLFMAKLDLATYSEMFGKMSRMCSKKCVQKYSDGELAVGEMTCVDRCTGKYLHASTVVEDIFKSIEAQAKEQQQMQQQFGK